MSDSHQTLVSLFQDGYKLNEDHAAVVYDSGTEKKCVTYLELKNAAELIKEELYEVCDGSTEAVGVTLSAGCYVPAVLIGIMSLPAAFYPLEFSMRSRDFHRLRNVISRLRVKVFIIDVERSSMFTDYLKEAGFSVFNVRKITCLNLVIVKLLVDFPPLAQSNGSVVDSQSTAETRGKTGSDFQLAYIITTSGTTGVPKIVRVPHSCIVPNITHIRKVYSMSSKDVVYHASPLTFDPSVVEIFTTLSVGATLLCTPESMRLRPRDLVNVLSDRNPVTILQATPTLISSLGASLLRQTLLSAPSHLRVLCFGGERCPGGATLRSWQDDGNTTTFFNIYGVTEISCWATFYELTSDDLQNGNDDIPLGTELDGTEIELRNTNVESGIGELWIGGHEHTCLIDDEVSLISGRMRFSGDLVKRSTDSQLYYIGRADDMIKRHGKRLHLQEIEKVAMKSDAVERATAVPSDNELVLFVQLSNAVKDQDAVRPTESRLSRKKQILGHFDEETVASARITDHTERPMDFGVADKHKQTAEFLTSDVTRDEHPMVLKRFEEQIVGEMKYLLEKWLPKHYTPDDIVVMTTLPFTKHGKVDKGRLMDWRNARRLVESRSQMSAAVTRTDVCHVITELWKKYISTDEIDDWQMLPFTSCGGDSVAALHLAEDIGITLENVAESEDRNSADALLLDKILHGTLRDVVFFVTESFRFCGSFEKGKFVGDVDLVGTDSDLHAGLQNNATSASAGKPAEIVENLSTSSVEKLVETNTNQPDQNVFSRKRPFGLLLSESPPHKVSKEFVGYSSEVHLQFTSCLNGGGRNISDDADSRESQIASIVDAEIARSISSDSEANKGSSNDRSANPVSHRCKNLSSGSCRNISSISRGSPRTFCPLCSVAVKEDLSSPVLSPPTVLDSFRASVVWKFDTGKCIDASPLLVTDGNQTVMYIGSHSHRLVALAVDTGTALWDIMLGDRIESSTALSSCGRLVIVGCYDGGIYFVNRLTGDVEWKYETGGQVKSSACVNRFNGLAYVGSHDGHLYALDVHVNAVCLSPGDSIWFSPWNRECRWKANLNSGSVFASPCLTAEPYQLVTATLGGHLVALNPETGDIEWKYFAGKPLFSSPTPCSVGYVIGCVDANIYGISQTGQQLWKYSTSGPVFSTATVCHVGSTASVDKSHCVVPHQPATTVQVARSSANDVLIVGSHDSKVHCISTRNGRFLWKVELDSEVYSTPYVFRRNNGIGSPDTAVVCSKKGSLYFIDITTGQASKLHLFPGETFSSPIVYDGRVFVGCRDNNIYCLQFLSEV